MFTTAAQREKLISELESVVRAERELAARRIELIARALQSLPGGDSSAEHSPTRHTSPEIEYRSLRAEIATALHISEHRADSEMSLAYSLTEHYPETVSALRSGEIDLQHAKVIDTAGTVINGAVASLQAPEELPPGVTTAEALAEATRSAEASEAQATERRALYEQAILPHALAETPNRLVPIARRLAEQWAVETIDERHDRERKLRRVTVTARDDGMADLVAYLPALEAFAIKARLTDAARGSRRRTNETPPLSLDELRADRTPAPRCRAQP